MFSIFYTFTVKTPRIAMMENKIICMIKIRLNTLYRYVDRKLEISYLLSALIVLQMTIIIVIMGRAQKEKKKQFWLIAINK